MKLNDFKQFNESAMTCSECGGPAFSDLILAEKQDACYHKVKSRYKVWPSAYASGALVQCRKKGAANWGNKSEGVNEMDSQGYKGSRDDYELGKGKEHTGRPVTAKQATTDAERIMNRAHNKMMKTMSPADKVKKGLAHPDTLKKKGVAEDISRRGFLRGLGAAALAGAGGSAAAGGYTPGKPNDWKYNMGVKRPGSDEPAADSDAAPMQSPAQTTGASSSPSAASKAAAERAMAAAEKIKYTNPKFKEEYERIENTYNQIKSIVYNNKRQYSSNPDLAKRQHAESVKALVAADKEFAEKTNALINQYGRLKEQGVAEGSEQINELSPETLKSYANKARAQVRASPGANPNNSHLPTDPKIANRARGAVKADNRLHGFGPAKKSTQGMAEGQEDSPVAQAITRRIMMQRTDLLAKYGPGYVGQAIDDVVDSVGDVEEIGSSDVSGWVRQVEHNLKNKLNQYDEPMNVGDALDEEHNPEYDDEAGMADNNLETLQRAVEGIDDLIQSGDNLPEWCQEKIAVAKSMLVAVWDYMESEETSDEVDPEVDEMFEAMDQLAEEIAARDNVDVDLVWESFESLDDHMLYETAAWRRKEGKSKTGGLNAKGVASYRRENPGSKLQTAVTTKPSKLKKGSKAAKRRKSFCARMSGVKGPMKKPNGKPTRKALALRKWNC